MYIAMNRFTVAAQNEQEFEALWIGRDSQLNTLPGFVEFHMLKGPEENGLRLYSSHTVWANKANFEAWTKSEQFRKAHARAGNDRPLNILGHPEFEGFEVVLHEDGAARRTAAE